LPLSTEILPELQYGHLLSGQPEAQGGLWLFREGNRGRQDLIW